MNTSNLLQPVQDRVGDHASTHSPKDQVAGAADVHSSLFFIARAHPQDDACLCQVGDHLGYFVLPAATGEVSESYGYEQ